MPTKTPVTPDAVIETPKTVPTGTRKLKKPKYRSFKLQKKIPKDVTGHPLPSAFKILKGAFVILKNNWKPFLGIAIIYALLNALLVKGLTAGVDLNELKGSVTGGASGHVAELLGGTVLFSYLVGTAGNASTQSGGIFQLLLGVVASLAFIWTLRQAYAGTKTRIRDGFYRGMYPFIPFLLVMIVVFLQLIPFMAGAYLYSAITTLGVSGAEMVIWACVFFLLVLLSLYMLTSSLFALYIVCLPDMEPIKALRAARALVRYRRWTVMRKVLFMPLVLVLISAVIMVPLIIFVSAVAVWAFFILGVMVLAYVHSYMYTLYRELL
ncbi:MAG TPA: hypothetical protein VD735_00655 [Candidatus Saccharimonadales bacterium]|nr:hypothetical protein [Candidatus Saccharimonadales bacterium]